MWDMPGGFVDPDESLEGSLGRELQEELGVEATSFKYIASNPNRYDYGGVSTIAT